MDKFNSQRDQIMEQGNLFMTTLDKERQTVSFKNPFDIPRHRLIHQVRTENCLLKQFSINFEQFDFSKIFLQCLNT